MEAMGRPHEAFESVHVAGTNGKGSTASLLAAISTASGRRTGLFTSPHLVRIAERLRLDGAPVADSWMNAAFARYRDTFDSIQPSFFEAATALGFLFFAESNVDIAVVEAGLGGRLDATNILQPRLSIITGIAFDHTRILGDTLPKIAAEKGGIIKPGAPTLTSAQDSGAARVLRDIATQRGSPYHPLLTQCRAVEAASSRTSLSLSFHSPVRAYTNLVSGAPGLHQTSNTLLATRAAELLFEDVRRDPTAVYEGVRRVRALAGLRARLETLQRDPLILLDVAHNRAGLEAALAFAQAQGGKRLFMVLAAMRDKDVASFARAAHRARAQVFACDLPSPRALTAQQLEAALRRGGATVMGIGSVAEAWERVRSAANHADIILIAGSHVLAGAILEMADSAMSR